MSCGTYQILYLGTDADEAAAVHRSETYCGEGPTLGEATRRAAMGAGQLTTRRRAESLGPTPKRQGPERKKPKQS